MSTRTHVFMASIIIFPAFGTKHLTNAFGHGTKDSVWPIFHFSQGRSGLPCEFDADLW